MTPSRPSQAVLSALRDRIERVAAPTCVRGVLPFGIKAIDAALPGRGLPMGAVHEIGETGPDAARATLATLFVAGILARRKGPVLWCLHSRDLFAPALARVGLHPDRVIYCETWKDVEVLPAMEEGLRFRGLAGVVGELSRLPLNPSRRLQLAAESSGVPALVVRRSTKAADQANAAFSRWQISAAPSEDGTSQELGRACWQVELLRCRNGEPNSWLVEALDAEGRLGVLSELRDRSFAADDARRASA